MYDAEILSRVTTTKGDRCGYEKVTGETPDISEWCDFSFYDQVWYWDTPSKGSPSSNIGRWLRILHRIGSSLSYWILTITGNVLSRTTVQHITKTEVDTESIKIKIQNFDEAINKRLGYDNFHLDVTD